MLYNTTGKTFAIEPSRILRLNYKNIYLSLKDLLDNDQIDATINRLHQIQAAIKRTAKENPNFLLEPFEWSDQTINEERFQNNETYFKYYLRKLGDV